ncbi:MAG: hypothetical protein SPI96_02555 [Micrococcus sp.]|nr:hypothetical protein [Micrococcus sp.]
MLMTYSESLAFADRFGHRRWSKGTLQELRDAAKGLLEEWLVNARLAGFEEGIYLDIASETGVRGFESEAPRRCNPRYSLVVDELDDGWPHDEDIVTLGWAGVYADFTGFSTIDEIRQAIRSDDVFSLILCESIVWSYSRSGGCEGGDESLTWTAPEVWDGLEVDREKIRAYLQVELDEILMDQNLL